jgi:hypothetical protein
VATLTGYCLVYLPSNAPLSGMREVWGVAFLWQLDSLIPVEEEENPSNIPGGYIFAASIAGL